MMKGFSVISVVALVLIGSARVADAKSLAVGDAAAPFRLSTADGDTISLGSYMGRKPVLLAFLSVRCAPCEESLPALRELAALQGSENGLAVLCILLTENPDAARTSALGQPGLDTPILLERLEDGRYTTASAYGVMGTPTFFLIGKDGKIQWMHVGRMTITMIERDFKLALRD